MGPRSLLKRSTPAVQEERQLPATQPVFTPPYRTLGVKTKKHDLIIALIVTIVVGLIAYGAYVFVSKALHQGAIRLATPNFPDSRFDEVGAANTRVVFEYKSVGEQLKPCQGIENEPYPLTCQMSRQSVKLFQEDLRATAANAKHNPVTTWNTAIREFATKKKADSGSDGARLVWAQMVDATRPTAAAETTSGVEPPPLPLLENGGQDQSLKSLLDAANDRYCKARDSGCGAPITFFGKNIPDLPSLNSNAVWAAVIFGLLFGGLYLLGRTSAFVRGLGRRFRLFAFGR